MSQFVVSARKYRPARFDEVVGQEHVTGTLKNALQQDKLAHAFLFCGPRGVGKTTCARILAKVINCQQPTEDMEPCGECPSCQAMERSTSFNIIELDGASNNSVEHIRSLIEQVRFQPQQGKYKVFIIDEVHMLSSQAFNAFLKTLEEPPPYAIFILATTEKHKIIPTILSRCQIYDFRRIQPPAMVAHLESICAAEGIEAEPEALHVIAQKADGALRDALSIFDRLASFSGGSIHYQTVIEHLNVLDHDYYFRVTDALLTEDLATVLLTLDEVLRKGFDADLFVNGLAGHFRQLLVCQDEATLPLLDVGEKLRRRYRDQAALAPPTFLLTALNIANDCDVEYRLARNKRLHVEMALIKMTYIHRAAAPAPAPGAEKKSPPPKVEAEPEKPAAADTAEDHAGKQKDEAQKDEAKKDEAQKDEAKKARDVAAKQKPEAGKNGEPPRPAKEASAEPTGKPKPKHGIPSITDLKDLTADLREQAEKDKRQRVEVTLERIRTHWAEYAEQHAQATVRNHMGPAVLELDGKGIRVEVGSKLAADTIRQETGLMEFLRDAFKQKELTLRVDVNKKLAKPKKSKPKTTMSNKEKYYALQERNPLLREACLRLGLTFDEPD